MVQGFKDHFGALAEAYLQNRPLYPAAVFEWIASNTTQRELALDCGTGNGQAAIGLADHFTKVVATDASAKQIDNAIPHERIEYRVAPAEVSGLSNGSVDALLVAQALHWFNFDRFFAEAQRILRPSGLFVALSYGVLTVEGQEVDAIVQRFYFDTVSDYWPPERKHVETAYRSIPFPFSRIETPAFSMEALWSLPQLIGYLQSWSAVGAYKNRLGVNPVEAISQPLAKAWGDPLSMRQVRWPLTVLAGHPAVVL